MITRCREIKKEKAGIEEEEMNYDDSDVMARGVIPH